MTETVSSMPDAAIAALDDLLADVGLARALVHYHETRFCVAIVGGPANLFVTMQLHQAAVLNSVISRLMDESPAVSVLDTRVVLRSVKSWGRLLSPDGRAQEVVPVDLWAPARS